MSLDNGRIRCRGQCRVSLYSVTSNKPLLTPTKYPYFIQAPPSRKRKCGVYVKSLETKDNGIWKLTINLHPRGQIIRTVDLGSR